MVAILGQPTHLQNICCVFALFLATPTAKVERHTLRKPPIVDHTYYRPLCTEKIFVEIYCFLVIIYGRAW